MGLELLLPLVIPAVSPVVVELIKLLTQKFINNLPPALVPNLSAAVGVMLAEGFRAGGLDLFPGVTSRQLEDVMALGLGYGGTGVHQALRQAGVTVPTILATNKKRAWLWPLLLPLVLLGGCSSTTDSLKAVQDDPAMKSACRALPSVIACATAMHDQMVTTDPKMANDVSSAVAVIRMIHASGCPPAP